MKKKITLVILLFFAYLGTKAQCSGLPVAGTIDQSQPTGCSAYSDVLTVHTPVISGGISYQWQTSTDSLSWASISGATNTSYTANITTSIYYRFYVVCNNTHDTAYSPGVKAVIGAPTATYVMLPYFQNFESWTSGCHTYERPDIHWILTPTTGDNSWRRDDQGTDAAWSVVTKGIYAPVFTEGAHSARFHNTRGSTVKYAPGTMDLYVNLNAAGTKRISFDYINTNGGDYYPTSLYVMISTDSGRTFTTIGQYSSPTNTGWIPEIITTTVTSPTAILRFQGNADLSNGDMGIDSLNIVLLPACAGKPAANFFTASQATGCAEYGPTLALNPNYTVGDIAYQWQTSTNGITYSNVPGATNASYHADVISDVYFRTIITCKNGNDTSMTPSRKLVIVTPIATYAALPYFQNFENWIGSCFNNDRPGINWLTNPSSGDNAWRRDDQGADATWPSPTDGAYSPAFTQGAHSARFHFEEQNGAGNMDLYMDLSAPGTKLITFNYINQTNNDGRLTVLISTDSVNWTQLAQYTVSSTWQHKEIGISIASRAIIRFQGNVPNAGEGDMGIDSLNITILPACAGMPVAGTFSNTQSSGCTSSYSSILSVDAPVYATGISYHWQSSPDNVTFTDIVGATGYTYTASVTTSAYYRFYVVCAATHDTAKSPVTKLTITPEVLGIAKVPYFQSFENWLSSNCDVYDRPDTNWIDNPTKGENSWRRDDQGSFANWGDNGGSYKPVFTDNAHSARFHSEGAQRTEGDMDLHVNFSTPGTKTITFNYNNKDGTDKLIVKVSTNGGNNFDTLGVFPSVTGWSLKTVTTNAIAANAIVRFAAISDWGASDIGIDSLNITVAPACLGMPVAGTLSSTRSVGCMGYNSTLSVDAPIYTAGISYHWQSSPDSITFTDVSGATAYTYIANVTTIGNAATHVYYRFYVVCANGNDTAYAPAVNLSLTPEVAITAQLPYFQSFENWTGTCYTYDRPDTKWLNAPNIDNNSWRREDQASDANWTQTGYGLIYPTATAGAHCARFHSTQAAAEGDLDLYVNFGGVGAKTISFDYNNNNGVDSLTVALSTDGGTTFDTLNTYYSGDVTHVTGWIAHTITTTAVSANAILRFAAMGDVTFQNTGSDIGIDSLYITGPAYCDTITGLSVTSITHSGATVNWSPVSGTAGYEVVVSTSSITPVTGTRVTAPPFIATNLTDTTTYHVFVRDSCSVNNFSEWDTLSFTTRSNLSLSNLIRSHFDVDAYPNPASGILTVKVSDLTSDNRQVQLTDVAGRIINTVNMVTDRVEFNMINLSPGIYFIKYEDDMHNSIIKVYKQ